MNARLNKNEMAEEDRSRMEGIFVSREKKLNEKTILSTDQNDKP